MSQADLPRSRDCEIKLNAQIIIPVGGHFLLARPFLPQRARVVVCVCIWDFKVSPCRLCRAVKRPVVDTKLFQLNVLSRGVEGEANPQLLRDILPVPAQCPRRLLIVARRAYTDVHTRQAQIAGEWPLSGTCGGEGRYVFIRARRRRVEPHAKFPQDSCIGAVHQ